MFTLPEKPVDLSHLLYSDGTKLHYFIFLSSSILNISLELTKGRQSD